MRSELLSNARLVVPNSRFEFGSNLQRLFVAICACLWLSCSSNAMFAQETTAEQKGFPMGTIAQHGDVDSVNLQNGNLHISIPIVSAKQRGGGTVSWSVEYDTQSWFKQYIPNNCTPACTPPGFYLVRQNPNVVSGWRIVFSSGWNVESTGTDLTCAMTGIVYRQYTNWVAFLLDRGCMIHGAAPPDFAV